MCHYEGFRDAEREEELECRRRLEDEIDKTRKSGRVEEYPDFKRHRLDNLYGRQIHYLELSMKFDKRI